MSKIGLVAIGRNEGERLRRCLESAKSQVSHVVYVDSGSTDGSVDLARGFGMEVVQLDMTIPFTAARARNEGVQKLRQVAEDFDYVQFIDGDCELMQGFIARASAHLDSHPQAAVVCGRRRERHPEASVYNRLCDIEWNTPIGLAGACGGDALMRLSAFTEAGGFNPEIIAGEEPDLCYRLRARGYEIWRIDADMTLHDAAMHAFSQWWMRNVRSGHASAEAMYRRGILGDSEVAKEVASNVIWGNPGAVGLWPLLFARVYRRHRDPAYAAFIVLGKMPHLQGQLRYWRNRLQGQAARIIEYK
jgi:glycosyltransferase involved in cell wall biosynthesis